MDGGWRKSVDLLDLAKSAAKLELAGGILSPPGMPKDHVHARCSFSGFELDVPAYELRREGRRIRLERQPMDLLILLVERRGELVLRSDIVAHLWPKDVFVDVDTGINTAVRKLRAALGDSPDAPAFIETVAGKGYRFIAVAELPKVEPEPSPSPQPTPRPPARRSIVTLAGALALLGLALASWLVSTPAPPRVTGMTQITASLVGKYGAVTDGSRVYFNERSASGASLLSYVSVEGGDVGHIAHSFYAATVVGASPDGSVLLVLGLRTRQEVDTSVSELWLVPIVGGTPRRVGDLHAYDAAWSADGQRIAFMNGSDQVQVALNDGSEARMIWTAPGYPYRPSWSPDGRKIRLTVARPDGSTSLWEVEATGANAVEVLPAFESPTCCGRWTTDGRYFLFDAYDRKDGAWAIWALRESGGFFSRKSAVPVRLTRGALHFHSPTPSPGGRKVFAVGEEKRGEVVLVRYDRESGQFVPYLDAISATDLEFSRDGQWVAYVALPEGTLWRSRKDGSDRLQLTRGPHSARAPRWSPDGKRIAFGNPQLPSVIDLVSADDGWPEGVDLDVGSNELGHCWSPDGRTLALGIQNRRGTTIQRFDLETRRFTLVPGSEELFDPQCSPDGRSLAALSGDRLRLLVYDMGSGLWRELLRTKDRLGFPSWSHDGTSLFVSDGAVRARVAIVDGRREVIASLEGLQRQLGTPDWVGRAPDDEVITVRDLGAQEMFALDWEAP